MVDFWGIVNLIFGFYVCVFGYKLYLYIKYIKFIKVRVRGNNFNYEYNIKEISL